MINVIELDLPVWQLQVKDHFRVISGNVDILYTFQHIAIIMFVYIVIPVVYLDWALMMAVSMLIILMIR